MIGEQCITRAAAAEVGPMAFPLFQRIHRLETNEVRHFQRIQPFLTMNALQECTRSTEVSNTKHCELKFFRLDRRFNRDHAIVRSLNYMSMGFLLRTSGRGETSKA